MCLNCILFQMNGRPVKDPFRVAKLVKNVRPQSRPPEGASLSFFNKIEHDLSNTLLNIL